VRDAFTFTEEESGSGSDCLFCASVGGVKIAARARVAFSSK